MTCRARCRRAGHLSLPAGAIALFHGAAAARVRQQRRALQRLAHVRATREAHACVPSAVVSDKARDGSPRHLTIGACGDPVRGRGLHDRHRCGKPPDTKAGFLVRPLLDALCPDTPPRMRPVCEECCVRGRQGAPASAVGACGVPRSPAILWPHRPLTAGR